MATLDLVSMLRDEFERGDAETARRIINAYQVIAERLAGDIDALVAQVPPEGITSAQLKRLAAYNRLLEDVNREMTKFGGYLQVELSQSSREFIGKGLEAGRLMTASVGGDAVIARWINLNAGAVEQLVGFLAPDSPLVDYIETIAPQTAERLQRYLLEGIGLGKNPRDIARLISRALGVSLTDALRLARTVNIYAYREANRASYIANSDVVQGWVWNSALQPGRTCMSCVAMHGTVHGLDETLNDHHNGLCTMLPLVVGAQNPVDTMGEAWFNGQPEAVQKLMLGNKYDFWKDGKIAIWQLTTTHTDSVFGDMRTEISLKALGLTKG